MFPKPQRAKRMGNRPDERSRLRSWYVFVREQPCCACGARASEGNPVEAAHVQALLSAKTGARLPRSHKGIAAFSCVPLCRACHLRQHQVGEVAFFADAGLTPGDVVATNLARFLLRDEP